ncbi:MAG: HD-GYP domain-containing protein [Cyanobacteriota bacterium]
MKKVIKSISTNEAVIGMVLANNVRAKSGELLFRQEHKLTISCISEIKKKGITFLYIYQISNTQQPTNALKEKDNIFPKIPINKVDNPNEPAKNIDDKEEEIYSIHAEVKSPPPLKDIIPIEVRKKGENIVKDLFYNPNNFQYNTAMNLVSTIVKDIVETDDTVVSINDLRSYDNYTYQHSLNLCVLGMTVAKLLDYSEVQLKEFGIGLLFHDFGKTKISLDILNKPAKLTVEEFEIMKNHAEYGYQVLSKKFRLPEISKLVIRHHHEKLDGSGYPMGLKAKEIPELVQISTIVDIYDALTADRIYKTHWTHEKAIEFLYDKSEKWFNKKYIRLLKTTSPEKVDAFSLLDF